MTSCSCMMKRRLAFLLPLGAALLMTALPAAGAPAQGGTFLVALPASNLDSIDAALTGGPDQLLSTVCASLMRLPDKPLPDGFHPAPELAADFPKISPDGKTYVFTIRRGLRFSTGAPVTARDVAYTINRILNPTLKSPSTGLYEPIVGADAVIAGKATGASGIVATRDTLTIRLTHPVGDFVAGAASNLCVLPEGDRKSVV